MGSTGWSPWKNYVNIIEYAQDDEQIRIKGHLPLIMAKHKYPPRNGEKVQIPQVAIVTAHSLNGLRPSLSEDSLRCEEMMVCKLGLTRSKSDACIGLLWRNVCFLFSVNDFSRSEKSSFPLMKSFPTRRKGMIDRLNCGHFTLYIFFLLVNSLEAST